MRRTDGFFIEKKRCGGYKHRLLAKTHRWGSERLLKVENLEGRVPTSSRNIQKAF